MAFDAQERSIWITTLNGVPQNLVWGVCKTEDEEPDPARKKWARVLDPVTQPTASGWDAVVTSWRRVPSWVSRQVFAHASSVVTIVDRTLTVNGAEYDLDDGGRARSIAGHEPEAPDAVLVDEDAIVTLASALGRDCFLMEKTTLKTVHVHATQDPSEPRPGNTHAGIYRQSSDNQVVRAEA